MLATLAVGALITVAACGDDDDDAGEVTTPSIPEVDATVAPATTTEAATDETTGDTTEETTADTEGTTDEETPEVSAGVMTAEDPPNRSRAARSSTGWRPTAPTRGRRTTRRARRACYVPLDADQRLAVRGHGRRRDGAVARRDASSTTPTTRSGRCTSATASSSMTARRSTATSSSSTSTPCQASPLTGAGVGVDRSRRGVGHGRHGVHQGTVGGAAAVLRRQRARPHVLASSG